MELSAKRLELIRSLVSRLSRVAVLLNGDNALSAPSLKSAQAVAPGLGLMIFPVDVRDDAGIEPAFARMVKEKAGAVMVVNDSWFHSRPRVLAGMALKYRLPTIYPYREYVEAGGLINYGQNLSETYRRSAGHVDRILKGAKPGDLPIEQPTLIHMAINRKTAKILGLNLPQDILLRADEVIE